MNPLLFNLNISCRNIAYDGESVGPHIRFCDAQTGASRLTKTETINQHLQLGKQRLEEQRCEVSTEDSVRDDGGAENS